MLVLSMVVYLLWLGCCLATTNQPDTPPTFKPPKHQIQS
jgi:outer membrane biogenesis lipoprotein LolB